MSIDYVGRTTAFLPESDDFTYCRVISTYTTANGPFAFEVDGSGYHVGQIFHSSQGHTRILASVNCNNATVLEVPGEVDKLEMFGRWVGTGQVVDEVSRLEQAVLENLVKSSPLVSASVEEMHQALPSCLCLIP